MKRCMESMPKLLKHINDTMFRCRFKKQNTATTQPQENIRQEGQIKKEEVHDLPSFQRQKSQQLVFPVHQACLQRAQTLHLLGM